MNYISKDNIFEDYGWRDARYGVPNVLYAFIWPIYVVIHPEKGFDVVVYDYLWAIGYIITIIYFIKEIIKNRENLKTDLSFHIAILSLVLSFVWAWLVMGYTRYGGILPCLYTVIFSLFVLNIKNLKGKIIKVISYVVSLIIALVMCSAILRIIFIEYFGFIKLIPTVIKKYEFFNDRETDKISIDGAWIAVGDDSGISTLIREEGTPIYNLETRFIASKVYEEKLDKLKHKKLYIALDKNNAEYKIKALNNSNFEIVEETYEKMYLNFLSLYNPVVVYRVEFNENREEVEKSNQEILQEMILMY